MHTRTQGCGLRPDLHTSFLVVKSSKLEKNFLVCFFVRYGRTLPYGYQKNKGGMITVTCSCFADSSHPKICQALAISSAHHMRMHMHACEGQKSYLLFVLEMYMLIVRYTYMYIRMYCYM